MITPVGKSSTSRLHAVRLIIFCLVLFAFDVFGQTRGRETAAFRIPPKAPVRLGDAARKLSKKDLTSIEAVLPEGKKPWMIFRDSSGPVAYLPPAGPPIAAYLPPDTVTPTLIRGTLVSVRQIGAHKWVAAGSSEYAYIVTDRQTWKEINWSQPSNRPFDLLGHFDDEEIVGIVNFIRTQRRSVGPVSVPIASGRPIRRMERLPEGTISVNLSSVDWSAEQLILKREGQGWTVVSLSWWVA